MAVLHTPQTKQYFQLISRLKPLVKTFDGRQLTHDFTTCIHYSHNEHNWPENMAQQEFVVSHKVKQRVYHGNEWSMIFPFTED